jgi:hypothetical protein
VRDDPAFVSQDVRPPRSCGRTGCVDADQLDKRLGVAALQAAAHRSKAQKAGALMVWCLAVWAPTPAQLIQVQRAKSIEAGCRKLATTISAFTTS